MTDNVEIVRNAYRILEETGAIPSDMLTDDFLLEQSRGILDTRGTFRGKGGMAASLAELRSGFDAIRFIPHSFTAHGDWVEVPVTFASNTRGVQQEAEVVHLWQLRDGLIARGRVVARVADAPRVLEQLQAEG